MKWLNLIFYLGMIGVNALANIIKIGGVSTGEVARVYSNVFTPAGWTFAIWGIIYGLLLVFVIGPFVKPNGKAATLAMQIDLWFVISCIFNIVWIFAWHSDMIILSFVSIAALLMSVYIIFAKITTGIGFSFTEANPVGLCFASAGFAVYFSWLMVAIMGNAMVMLVSMGLNGYGIVAQILSIIFLLAGGGLIGAISSATGNWVIGLAGMWSYIGVIYRQFNANELDSKYKLVITAAILGIALITAGSSISLTNLAGGKKTALDGA